MGIVVQCNLAHILIQSHHSHQHTAHKHTHWRCKAIMEIASLLHRDRDKTNCLIVEKQSGVVAHRLLKWWLFTYIGNAHFHISRRTFHRSSRILDAADYRLWFTEPLLRLIVLKCSARVLFSFNFQTHSALNVACSKHQTYQHFAKMSLSSVDSGRTFWFWLKQFKNIYLAQIALNAVHWTRRQLDLCQCRCRYNFDCPMCN